MFSKKKFKTYKKTRINEINIKYYILLLYLFNTIRISYYYYDCYTPKSNKVIRYIVPYFKFNCPHKPIVISKRDNNFEDFYG